MPPAASTHPREPEIRRLAEPAAAEQDTCVSHPAQVSTDAGAEDDLESGVGTRERANRGSCSSCLPERTLNAPWTSPSHPASRETASLHFILML